MIPSGSGFLPQKVEIKEQPSKTYCMNRDVERISGFVDNLEAMEQVIFKILNTERYQYVIYSWNYGIETMDLYGQDKEYVMPVLKNRISEALLWDSRIKSVNDFVFSTDDSKINCTFVVHTIFGNVNAEKAVNI